MIVVSKERPILFNADMVRAILKGHKTQTRRILNIDHPVVTGFVPNGHHGYWMGTAKSEEVIQQYISTFPLTVKCPYGLVGDRLWVRETFAVYGDEEMHTIHYRADRPEHVGRKGMGYKPSIHMPRWACRLLLEITDIRVERLNAISKEDAAKEGFQQLPATGRYVLNQGDQYFGGASSNPCELFKFLWEGVYGENAWKQNPWVWVVEFKIIARGMGNTQKPKKSEDKQ